MGVLSKFLGNYRRVLVFFFLEGVGLSWWKVAAVPIGQQWVVQVTTPLYQIERWVTDLKHFVQLDATIQRLQEENLYLMQKQMTPKVPQAALPLIRLGHTKYSVLAASVVNNSVAQWANYLTLNRGEADGVHVGMGVITSQGVVGQVCGVSAHFSTVISVLHPRTWISASLKETGVLGSIRWPGDDPKKVSLSYVPRHAKVSVGDQVVTSGYNAVFPPGIPIGIVEEVQLDKNAPFYRITLQLIVDLSAIQGVYLVANPLRQEQHALERKTRQNYVP